LAQFSRATGVSLHGPALGLDANNVYIFWSLEKRGGLGAGTASCYRLSFPLGQPSAREVSTVRIPPISNPLYIAREGAYNYRWLAPPLGEWSSEFVHMPTPLGGQRSELAVALGVKVQPVSKAQLEQIAIVQFHEEAFWPGDRGPVAIGFGPQVQVALAIFADGELKGYQIATRTKAMSLQPSIAVDAASNLHLAWLETAGFWRFDIYYATTSPQAKAWLDRTSPQDVLLRAIDLGWGMLSGLTLVPFMVVWIFPPLLERAPSRFASAIVLGVPLATLTLALTAVYAYARRARDGSLFRAFITFVLIDTFLSLTIYSLGLFGGY